MKIALLCMPFLSPALPSLGLTQVKGRLKELFGDRLEVRLFYVNHEFCNYFGVGLYSWLDVESITTAIGDWIFRKEAFDNVTNNQEKYLARFYSGKRVGEFNAQNIQKIMNLGNFIDEIINRYHLDSFDLVGINATFSTVPGLAFCRHLKKINKEIVTVMGGASVYMEMGEALGRRYPHLDYVCSGSGLVSFPRLLEALVKDDAGSIESIDGIFSKKNRGQVRGVSEELDINHEICLDYSDFFESFEAFQLDKHFEPTILLETSRGCYWKRCRFCGLNENRHRYTIKRVDKAVEEINDYFQKYNCHIEMVDNVMPRHYIKKVLPLLEVPEGKKLIYEVRADYEKEEMEILSETGVTFIQPGIESLSTEIHALMDKGVNAFQCINLLKSCCRLGIKASWNLLIGFPGMTEEMYRDLMRIIPGFTHLVPPTNLRLLRFDRYSAYWEEPGKYDLNLHPAAFYEYIYPYDREFLLNFSYFFEDRNYTSQRNLLMGEYYSTLQDLIDYWNKRWRDGNSRSLPQLYRLTGKNGPYVYDSRQETIEEYQISRLEDGVLEWLESPRTVEEIQSHFSGENPGSIVEILGNLESKRLVFREGRRYMSLLVSPHEKA